MIIVDTALKKRQEAGNPIRVGIVGAGFMGKGLVLQIESAIAGMRVVAVSNRTLSEAETAFRDAGHDDIRIAATSREIEDSIRSTRPCVTENALELCKAEGIDAVIEATGEVEFGLQVVLTAISSGKHVILMNAELDAVLGPILKVKADQAGVVITNVDGDQPGVVMNLFRFVDSIGYRPVLAGNIKGLQDHYRNPETQRGFAEEHGQKPKMITSFADGTKISMEMAVVSNATGFRVAKRGMHGKECKHVSESPGLFNFDELMDGGIVDFILGAEPGPGVFVLGYNDNPIKQHYMRYLKMGDGPLYVFYVPYHLPHLEAPLTVARAVLFQDAATRPLGPPVAEVLTAAKRDLQAGHILDGIGGFDCYGLIDNADTCRSQGLLPMSLSEGCKLRVDVRKDAAIRVEDVSFPEGRLIDQVWREQLQFFSQDGNPKYA